MSLFRCGWLVQEIRVLFWHKLKLNSPKNETWFLMRKSTDRVKSLGPISLWPLPSQYYKFCPPGPPLNFVGGGFQPKRIPHISACAKPIPILQPKGLQANNPEESDFIKRIPHISACAKPIPIIQPKGLQANNPEESDFIPSTSKKQDGKNKERCFDFRCVSDVIHFMFALYILRIRYIQGILV